MEDKASTLLAMAHETIRTALQTKIVKGYELAETPVTELIIDASDGKSYPKKLFLSLDVKIDSLQIVC